MDRLDARGLRLNRRQSTHSSEVLIRADREYPSPPFWGIDDKSQKRIDDRFRDDNREFARAAWGREWEQVFGENEELPAYTQLAREDPAWVHHTSYCGQTRSRMADRARYRGRSCSLAHRKNSLRRAGSLT